VLEEARGLSAHALEAIADLEARTVQADGGRLKLEWSTLRGRAGAEVEDLLWWQGERLAGFVGLYAFGPPTVELAGMVDPEHRRRGIATALLEAALPICRDRGYERALLVTPRGSEGGPALAGRHGAVLEHSEHVLVLTGAPHAGSEDPLLSLRPATPADAPMLTSLLGAAFGTPPHNMEEVLASDPGGTVVIDHAGQPVGTIRLAHDGATGSVYGFAVDPAWQGRGIGRDALGRVCRQLRDEGAQRVQLEVAVHNDRALGLYTSLGFSQIHTEDYYVLPLGPAAST
jgi:ribosomal protein S18 acetylase RimI-like enzyme